MLKKILVFAICIMLVILLSYPREVKMELLGISDALIDYRLINNTPDTVFYGHDYDLFIKQGDKYRIVKRRNLEINTSEAIRLKAFQSVGLSFSLSSYYDPLISGQYKLIKTYSKNLNSNPEEIKLEFLVD